MTVDVAAEICSEAGVCAPLDPLTALVIIGLKALTEEANKKDGFGPNGAVAQAVNTVLGDLQRGNLGPNNEIVRAWETARNDLLNGWGENNDIRKFLAGFKINWV